MAPARRGASAAAGGRSRRRLVDPEGAAELAADALGLRPGGVGPEHHPVPVVGIARLEHAPADPPAGELFPHPRPPGPVLSPPHLPLPPPSQPPPLHRPPLLRPL